MLKSNNKLAVALAVTSGFFVSNLMAQVTVTGNAQVSVQNSFTLVETQDLTFGTVVAIGDDDAAVTNDVASMTIAANDGTATFTNGTLARLTEIVPGQVGIFDISGAAPNTAISLTLPAGPIQVTDPSNTYPEKFQISGFTSSVVTSGTPFTYDTTASGDLTFNVGATLSTDPLAASGSGGNAVAYNDTIYTGTYTITADY